MVGIYADESETAETPRVFSLVCCVGSPSGWARLEPEWRRMLLEGGPDPVSAFHAKDVAQGKNEFSAWSGEAREAFYARAIDLLFDDTLLANMYVAGCAMVVDDFAEAIPGGWKPLVADLLLEMLRYSVEERLFDVACDGRGFRARSQGEGEGSRQRHVRGGEETVARGVGGEA